MSESSQDKENRGSYADGSLLGKETQYENAYSADLLHIIPREDYRETIPAFNDKNFPIHGHDVWHAYEISCLLPNGKPHACIIRMLVPASSSAVVESKSLKLYLNSFNFKVVADQSELVDTIARDLSLALNTSIVCESFPVGDHNEEDLRWVGRSKGQASSVAQELTFEDALLLDELDVTCNAYEVDSKLLALSESAPCYATCVSHLLRSNCPITNQPDWGSIYIAYDNRVEDGGSDTGEPSEAGVDTHSLLRYIVSYRRHNGFHEQTVEKIFSDLLALGLRRLFVCAQYTRRGGIDINPIRTTGNISLAVPRVNRL